MDNIASFAVEGRKHHMSYGQFVRAVERGEFTPPPSKDNSSVSAKSRNCVRCGKAFDVKLTACGRYSQARLCKDCLTKSRVEHGSKRRVWSEYIICKKCGLPFKRERYPNGRFMDRKYCNDCTSGIY